MRVAAARVEACTTFPGRVQWPCGHRPFRRTLRAWRYATHYWVPRVATWLYIVAPPVVLSFWLLPVTAATADRVLLEGAVLLAAVLLAAVIDLVLYAPLFHGRLGGPGILHAAELAEDWRNRWMDVEAHAGQLPDVSLALHESRTISIPNFDPSPIIENPANLASFTQAIQAGFSRMHVTPLVSLGVAERYNTLLIVQPLAEPARLNACVWAIVHLLNIAAPDSCRITAGYTYWRPVGPVEGAGWYRGDEATLRYVLPLAQFFSFNTFLRMLAAVIAVAAWPVGMLVLIAKAIIEVVTHRRYTDFLASDDPSFGDSLDLALLCRAVEENSSAFSAKPDLITTERLRAFAAQIQRIVQEALLAAGGGRGPGY